MSATPGRNAPCPCGSGRKYKQCCLASSDALEQTRVRIRRAEGHVIDALFPYALDRFGKPFFECAWLDFWSDEPPEADDFGDIPEFAEMFMPWFLTSFVRDPHGEDADPAWPDVPLGLHWLETERPLLDALEREWLVTACHSPMSVFVVETVEIGRSLDIHDVLTGRRFHVLEATASRSLQAKDLIFTRVVTAGGISLMFGMAPIAIPPALHLDVLDWRDRTFRRRTPTRHDLGEFADEIRELYLALADRVRHPGMPQLRNTDGDPFEPTTVVFDLLMPVPWVVDQLRPLWTLGSGEDDEHIDEVERDEAGAIVSAVLTWVKAGNRQHKHWDNTILGHLRVTSGRLAADVNSRRRADRLQKEVARLLGKAAVLRSRSTTDASELVAAARPTPAGAPAGKPGSKRDPDRPPEFDAIEDDLYRQHVESWIDTRVPALGNRTPRQTARTARGRERLDALLGEFERGADAARPARREALAALRQALGLVR